MIKILITILLIMSILLHELHRIIIARGQPRGTHVGGNISVAIWFISYALLLGLALSYIWFQEITIFTWIGYAAFIASLVFRSLALKELGRYYSSSVRVQKNHIIINSGVYHYFRHPLHLGLCGEMFGFLIIAPTWHGTVLIIISLITLIFRNINEERLLENTLGEQYRDYKESRAWDIIDLLPWLK